MTTFEILTTVTSGLALFISILAIILSTRANNKSTKFAEGSNEIQFRQLIMAATNEMLSAKNKYEESQNQSNLDGFMISVENYLNVYDDLCGLFINDNVDKINFYRKYKNDIQNLVEDSEFKDYYFPKETSKYANTVRVYEHFKASPLINKKIK